MRYITKFVIWVLSTSITSLCFAQDSELLHPDIAFQLRSQFENATTLNVTWDIQDEYYMYKDKFIFQPEDDTKILNISYPAAKTKRDPTFGDVEIYEKQANFTLTLEASSKNVHITAIGQGCNEPIGVCYAPLSKSLKLVVPAAYAQTPVTQPLDPVSNALPQNTNNAVMELRSLLGDVGMQAEFLTEDEAFQLNLDTDPSGESLTASFNIANGYYLYQDKIEFSVVSGNAQLRALTLPAGIAKHDENFGNVIVYTQSFATSVGLIRRSPEVSSLNVLAKYQGCAEKGICYPPTEKQFTLELPGLIGVANATTIDTENKYSEQQTTVESSNKGFLGYLISAFGIGILLTFTPCVLPMIPILSSIIVGQSNSNARMKGGMLSIIYVAGTAITYAMIGWVAGATGDQLQSYFQNIWALGTLSVVFVLMALSMFGLYTIQMPSFIQSRLQDKSANLNNGTIGMVLILGILSALVVGACVSPLLISLLSIAIAAGDPLLGAAMMVSMSLGMGVFLIAIGFGASIILPKAGPWMNRINHAFGILLLGVAIYILTAIPSVPVLLLWAILLIVTSIYLGATQSLPEKASGWQYLQKGIGTVLLVWGILALIGGMNNQRDIMQPISLTALSVNTTAGQAENTQTNDHSRLFTQIASNAELDKALTNASLSNKHVMLDFYADWCTDCIKMEKSTFIDRDVQDVFSQHFHLLQVDLTDPNNPDTKAIKKRLGVYGPPAMLFFKNGEQEIKDLRLYGYRNAQEFLKTLKRI